jgi:putative endonuclease
MTNNVVRRVLEHKSRPAGAFCTRYNITRLVFIEEADGPSAAIEREKQIKAWRRSRKVGLIESFNPGWGDLSEGWVADDPDACYVAPTESGIPRLRRLRSE